MYEDMKYVLKESPYSFEITNDYAKLIEKCKTFLLESNGSPIPDDLPTITLVEYEPIFALHQLVKVPEVSVERKYPIKLIGEG